MPTSSEEYSDSENGDEWLLGFLEKAPPASLLRHQFPSKVGGRPAWLDPVDLPHEDQFRCLDCQGFMNFLLQIYAPVTDVDAAFHRTMFVFVSPQGSSISKPGGCRAFRCQLPRENSFYSFHPPDHKSKKPPPIPEGCVVNDPWRVRENETLSSPTNPAQGLTLFPEFDICIREESQEAGSHKKALDTAVKKPTSDGIGKGDLDFVEKMLTPEQKAFAAFESRIARDPSQCIRYRFDAEADPIWPNDAKVPSPEDIPNCPRCGAARQFEFQVLPQVVHYLGADATDPEAPDWGCIAVYSCSESCTSDRADTGSAAYAEEFVWVQPP
ncbi:hypothetical protein BSKO_11560 [Bryopsis sp. KO-2023]|nr:hypothetical protein BSKO_11560 [Bryopsis sp. KO-2023]